MTEPPVDVTAQRRARRLFWVAAALSFGLLVWLGLGMTFFADDWAFIESRSLADPGTWLPPHNEHWSTLPILLYRLMVETIGIGSYVPYLVVIAALHVVVAWFVYVLLERRTGPLVALAGGVIVLLFGSGFENLFWGFQTGFIGSLALGLGALVVMDGGATRRRAIVVAVLLLAALMCSSTGAVMCVAVGVEWVVDPRWRRYLPALLLPAGASLAWLLAFGRAALGQRRDPLSLEAIRDVPAFVADGIGNALTSVTGLPAVIALVAVALVATAALAGAQRAGGDGEAADLDQAGIRPARVIGLFVAIATLYALSGLVRAQTLVGAADYPRYTYLAGIMALVLVGSLVGRVTLPAAGARRTAAIGLLGGWIAAALILNLTLLLYGRALFLDRADMTRALTIVALDPDAPAGVDRDRSLVLIPSPASMARIAAAYGDPRTDSLVPWAVRPVPPEVLAEARRRLIEGAPIPGVSP